MFHMSTIGDYIKKKEKSRVDAEGIVKNGKNRWNRAAGFC